MSLLLLNLDDSIIQAMYIPLNSIHFTIFNVYYVKIVKIINSKYKYKLSIKIAYYSNIHFK